MKHLVKNIVYVVQSIIIEHYWLCSFPLNSILGKTVDIISVDFLVKLNM